VNTGEFAQKMVITLGSRIFSLFMGMGASIILARVLGPQGRGVYALAMLLPNLIVTLGNFGVASATTYYVARDEIPRKVILGNNILLSIGIGLLGVLVGGGVILFFQQNLFKGVDTFLLFFALAFIPLNFFYSFIRYILLGAQYIKEFNYVQITQTTFFLVALVITLLRFDAGVIGAMESNFLSVLVASLLVFYWAIQISDGIDFALDFTYLKQSIIYGFQVHLMNILGFLNYRMDVFLVNWFLGPSAVGLYVISVGLIEKIWMVSQSAGMVLFPKIAAEGNVERNKKFTPFLARTVLWITALGAIMLAAASKWVILTLYSESFLPAVNVLRGLVIGIVALSAGRILSNALAGYGRPVLNIYTGIVAVITNVVLNLLWVPRYGIVGAAWASSVSYTVSFLGSLYFYCRFSNQRWTEVIVLQKEDWKIYRRTISKLIRRT